MYTKLWKGVTLSVCVCLSATARQADELDRALEQYAWVNQIHVTASLQLSVMNDRELCCVGGIDIESVAPIAGASTYIADGDSWRLESHMDPARYPDMDTTIVYDGQVFAYYEASSGLLATQADPNPDVWGMMLPNPAFEMVQFLFPMTEQGTLRQPRLADVKALAATTTLADLTWTTGVVDGVLMDRTEFPGGSHEGVAYTFVVYTGRGAHARPLVIDRVGSDGALLTRTRLSNYETVPLAGGESAWPRVITQQVFDPADGLVAVQMSAVVEQWLVNEPAALPAGAFDVSAIDATMHVHEGEIVP